jgi:hypothetical protein
MLDQINLSGFHFLLVIYQDQACILLDFVLEKRLHLRPALNIHIRKKVRWTQTNTGSCATEKKNTLLTMLINVNKALLQSGIFNFLGGWTGPDFLANSCAS